MESLVVGIVVVVEVEVVEVEVEVVEVEVEVVDVVEVDVVEVVVGAIVSTVRIVVVGRAIVGGGTVGVGVGVGAEVVVVVRGGAIWDESAGASTVVGEMVVGVTTMDCGVAPGSVSGGVVEGGTVEGAMGGTVGSGCVVARSAGPASGTVVFGTVSSTASMAAADCSARAAYAWCAIGVATPAVTAVDAATANRTRAAEVPERKGFRRARNRMALSRRQ